MDNIDSQVSGICVQASPLEAAMKFAFDQVTPTLTKLIEEDILVEQTRPLSC